MGTKEKWKPLIFIECLKLLKACVDEELINKDTNYENDSKKEDRVLVFRGKGKKFPRGWYSVDISDLAQELMEDVKGQKFLYAKLKEKKPDYELERYDIS